MNLEHLFKEYDVYEIKSCFQDLIDDWNIILDVNFYICSGRLGYLCPINNEYALNRFISNILDSDHIVKFCRINLESNFNYWLTENDNIDYIYKSIDIIKYLNDIKFCISRLDGFTCPKLDIELDYFENFDKESYLPRIEFTSTIKTINTKLFDERRYK